MKTAFFEIKDWEKDYISGRLKSCGCQFFSEELTSDNAGMVKDADIISVFIYSKLNAVTLSKFPNLRCIATRSTGFDHIDIEYCQKRGIKVFNVPQYGSDTVAEHTFMLILALAKRFSESVKRVKEGNFSPEGLTGIDLKGKTIGVIGTGKIGMSVIKIANGFSMKVVAYDVNPNEEKRKEENFEYVSLDNLLNISDIVTLHIPYGKETHHLVNSEKMALMKKGAYLINTSRGEWWIPPRFFWL